MERWRTVNDGYEVSDHGRVRNRRTGRVLKPGRANKSGHLTVCLGRGNKRYVHHLVATAFLGKRPRYHEVRHRDGNSGNNFWRNLEWATRGRNSQDKKHHDGQANYKLSPAQVEEIRFRLAIPYHGLGAELAREYGVSDSVISAIKNGRIHKDLL